MSDTRENKIDKAVVTWRSKKINNTSMMVHDEEDEMLKQLCESLDSSPGSVIRMALHGMYCSHFGRK